MNECSDKEKTDKKHEIHQNIKTCAEYIQFYSTTKKIIPLDSEKVHFLHRWLSLTKQKVLIPTDYDTLCLRIHDACTCFVGWLKYEQNSL